MYTSSVLSAAVSGNFYFQKAVKKQSEQLEEQQKNAEIALRKTEDEEACLRDECKRLESQIISSPEKLTSEVKKLQMEKDELAKEIKDTSGAVALANDRKDDLARVDSLLSSITVPFEEIMREKVSHGRLFGGGRGGEMGESWCSCL